MDLALPAAVEDRHARQPRVEGVAALAELAAQVGPVVRKELLAFVIQLKVPFLEQQAAEA